MASAPTCRTRCVRSQPAKFSGPAVTVQLKKEEHKEGAAASQGMLDLIDSSPPGSVYVMVLDGRGGLRRHRRPDGHRDEVSWVSPGR